MVTDPINHVISDTIIDGIIGERSRIPCIGDGMWGDACNEGDDGIIGEGCAISCIGGVSQFIWSTTSVGDVAGQALPLLLIIHLIIPEIISKIDDDVVTSLTGCGADVVKDGGGRFEILPPPIFRTINSSLKDNPV
ncbi:hypothetical protein V6N13_138653 [Hibiscus sabdariffa]